MTWTEFWALVVIALTVWYVIDRICTMVTDIKRAKWQAFANTGGGEKYGISSKAQTEE